MTTPLTKEVTRGDVHPELPRSHLFHLGGWGKGSASIEEANFLAALVLICKPRFIAETGSESGWTAAHMAHSCRANGFGRVLSMELHEEQALEARQNIRDYELEGWCEIRVCDSMAEIPKLIEEVDFAYLDTAIGMRGMELRALRPHLSRGAIVAIHDTSELHPHHGGYMILEDIKELGLQTITLPSPRGLTILQAR